MRFVSFSILDTMCRLHYIRECNPISNINMDALENIKDLLCQFLFTQVHLTR